MTDRFKRIEVIFAEVVALDAAERAAALDRLCADDETLRREILALLHHDETPATLLRDVGDQPIIDSNAFHELLEHEPAHPQRIGRYAIERLLGSGGMGVVYLARQEQPSREVALKVLRADLASPSFLKRFEHEAEVLGRLRHEGVARIYEAGTAETPAGVQPFLAMELIDGRPLVDFADGATLDARARLELVARICDAVQHAHNRGVIHRDLKPPNILVTDDGRPIVLDFGIARSLDDDASPTLQTDVGQLLGTVPYMSPEQVAGRPDQIDARCDVYALGVIAYRLLAGRVPLDVSGLPIAEAARVIGEDEPRPLGALDPDLAGDVEVIVDKALEKDPDRRYETPAELAADIRRYLDHQPIEARPATAFYQLQKFARRHRGVVGAAASIAVVLIASTIVMALLLVRAINAEQEALDNADRARDEADRSRQVAAFSREVLSSANPRVAFDYDTTLLREMLEDAATRINTELDGQPAVQAAMRSTVGMALASIGRYGEAEPILAAALEGQREFLGSDSEETLRVMVDLANVTADLGRFDEALALYEEAIDGLTRTSGADVPFTLEVQAMYGVCLSDMARFDESREVLYHVYERQKEILGEEAQSTISTLSNISTTAWDAGDVDESVRLSEQILEIRLELLGPSHPETLNTMNNLAAGYTQLERFDEAEPIHRDVLAQRLEILGEEHRDTLVSRNNLAWVLSQQMKCEEAIETNLVNLEIRRRTLDEGHPDTLLTMRSIAADYMRIERFEDAESLLLEAYEAGLSFLGPDHTEVIVLGNQLGAVYMELDRTDEAIKAFEEALERGRAVLPAGHWFNGLLASGLGSAFSRVGRYDEAEPLLLEAWDVITASLGETNGNAIHVADQIALMYENWERPQDAAPWRERAREAGGDTDAGTDTDADTDTDAGADTDAGTDTATATVTATATDTATATATVTVTVTDTATATDTATVTVKATA